MFLIYRKLKARKDYLDYKKGSMSLLFYQRMNNERNEVGYCKTIRIKNIDIRCRLLVDNCVYNRQLWETSVDIQSLTFPEYFKLTKKERKKMSVVVVAEPIMIETIWRCEYE